MTEPASPTPSLYIYGCSSHGLVTAEAACAQGWRIRGFLDDRLAEDIPPNPMGLPVHQPGAITPQRNDRIIIAIGDNATRQSLFRLMQSQGWQLANVIHPRAWVSPSAMLGVGIYVGPMATVNALAQLGDGVIVNSAATVEHHCMLGAFAHACPGSVMAGHVQLGQRALFGTAACARPGVTIGQRCIVGAGACVVHDLPDNTLATGVPARVVRQLDLTGPQPV